MCFWSSPFCCVALQQTPVLLSWCAFPTRRQSGKPRQNYLYIVSTAPSPEMSRQRDIWEQPNMCLMLRQRSTWSGQSAAPTRLWVSNPQRGALSTAPKADGSNPRFKNCSSQHQKFARKIEQLRILISHCRGICVLTLNETWLNEEILDGKVSIPGFNIHRSDRTGCFLAGQHSYHAKNWFGNNNTGKSLARAESPEI